MTRVLSSYSCKRLKGDLLKRNSKRYNESLRPINNTSSLTLTYTFLLLGPTLIGGSVALTLLGAGILNFPVLVLIGLVMFVIGVAGTVISATSMRKLQKMGYVETYSYEGKNLRVYQYRENRETQILFNTKEIYNIIGREKSDGEPSCLNFATVKELAKANNSHFRIWLSDALPKYANDTVPDLRINDDWTNIQDRTVWLDNK
jgi:hypothetical protein